MASKRSYYGAFYRLALAAFIVPALAGAEAPRAAPRPDASGVDHVLWDRLLKAYVENGLVDYQGMKRDDLFKTYLRQLGSAQPDKLETDADRLALLCNAYNAFVIDGVIVHAITDSVSTWRQNLRGFFAQKEHILAGETISLNRLEHQIIRVEFAEPRIHVALVCAAKSCPPLRSEAYVGAHLDRQLEDQTRQFANDEQHVAYDKGANTLFLSSILKWYKDDFDDGGGVLEFVAARVEDPALKDAVEKARTGAVKVKYNRYDWTLNSRKGPAPGASGGGTSPNE